MHVDAVSLTLVLATVFFWGVFSVKAGSVLLTAPIVFVLAGYLYADVFDVLQLQVGAEPAKLLLEVALVWLLFSAAAGVDLRSFRADAGLYARLLGLGFPLTVALGTLLAVLVLGLDWWPALFIGAALAPTDAALGAAVITNPAVPERTRRTLNVESGLNDGLATPVVLVAIAGVAVDAGLEHVEGPGRVVATLVVGVLIGLASGLLGGLLTSTARRRRWMSGALAGPAVLALALMTYTLALVVDGNGFVAAFVAGLAFGATAGYGGPGEVAYVEETGNLVSLLAWLLFGAVGLPLMLDDLWWQQFAYAALSLTVVRMLPVALALAGTSIPRSQVAFIGWFGPRGLASVIFAMLALEELDVVADDLLATVALTVLLSVVLHGASAGLVGRGRDSPTATEPAPGG
jgi:NhaP-type Na+/H+ or K+/H+ antiporter